MSLHPNGCQHDGYKALNAARAPDVQPYYCGECLAIHLSEGVEEEMKAEINGLRERVKELEEHDENHEERLKELENLTKELQNKMMFMKPGDGEGFDADAFAKLLEQYTNKADFESLKERVEKLEKELDEHKSKSKKKLKKHKE